VVMIGLRYIARDEGNLPTSVDDVFRILELDPQQ
jgi:hypothetical protein